MEHLCLLFLIFVALVLPSSADTDVTDETYVELKESQFCVVYEVTHPMKKHHVLYSIKEAMPSSSSSDTTTSTSGFQIPRFMSHIVMTVQYRGSIYGGGGGVLSSMGTVVLSDNRGIHTFLPDREGAIEACFLSTSPPSLFLNLFVFKHINAGTRRFLHARITTAAQKSSVGNDKIPTNPMTSKLPIGASHIDEVHGYLHHSNVLMKRVIGNVKEYSERVQSSRSTAESSFTRVWGMGFLTIVVVFVLAVGQYINLKKYLLERKLV
eukprot:PhF_6_TR38269/c0_g1_i2/m.57110